MEYSRLAKRFNLSDYAYAHRGLWTETGPPENSLDAFATAAGHGLGIEFDVRPSADGIPVIFHDRTLDRTTQHKGAVEDLTAEELSKIELGGGGNIPTLSELLKLWPTEAPLLCEMKIDGRTDPVAFAKTVAEQLLHYEKPAAAMSFWWDAVSALPNDLMRGQLIDASERIGVEKFVGITAKAVPPHCDYIACHVSDAARIETNLPVCIWTVKDSETSLKLKPLVPAQIFEGFDPELVKPRREHK